MATSMATTISNPAATSTAPITTTSASTSLSDEKTMALLAHLLGIFTGFVGPLVIWLVKKDQSPFVERHAREALNFQITAALAAIVGVILSLIIIGIFILMAVGIAVLVFCILATLAASKGNEYRYPLTLRLIKGPAGSA